MSADPSLAPTSTTTSAASRAPVEFWRTGNDEIGDIEDGRPAESDFSFDDLIDFLNPLHHIPVISDIYREISGDTIRPEIKTAASALFGPIGLISGVAKAVITAEMTQNTPAPESMIASKAADEPAAPVETAQPASSALPAAVPAGSAGVWAPTAQPATTAWPEPTSPIEDLILRGLVKYDAMQDQVG